MGWGAAAAVGISALSGSRQAKSSGKASVADIEQQGKANLNNLEARADATRFNQFQTAAQLREMEEVLGDKLSAEGLKSLQREATLKAATAETGTSGTSQEEAIYNEYVQENFTNAALVRDMDIRRQDSKMGLVADLLNFEQGSEALIFGQPSALGAGYRASANAGSAFQSGFGTTYKMLSGLGGGSSTLGSGKTLSGTTGSSTGGFNLNDTLKWF